MCRTMTGGTRRWRHLHSSDSSRLLDHYLNQQLLKRPILSHHCWLDWKHTCGTAPRYRYSGPYRNQREHKKRPWEDVVCFERMFDVKKRWCGEDVRCIDPFNRARAPTLAPLPSHLPFFQAFPTNCIAAWGNFHNKHALLLHSVPWRRRKRSFFEATALGLGRFQENHKKVPYLCRQDQLGVGGGGFLRRPCSSVSGRWVWRSGTGSSLCWHFHQPGAPPPGHHLHQAKSPAQWGGQITNKL